MHNSYASYRYWFNIIIAYLPSKVKQLLPLPPLPHRTSHVIPQLLLPVGGAGRPHTVPPVIPVV